MRSRSPAVAPPRTIAQLDEPEVTSEIALRRARARVVADVELLQHDFPQLATAGTIGE